MSLYYRRHGIDWCHTRFAADWEAGENRLLWMGDERIGYLRLWQNGGRIYLQDLQVVAGHRDRGWGGRMLNEVKALACSRDIRAIRLKVFEDSPAVRLYRQHGFETLVREPPLIGMALPVGRHADSS